MQRSIFIDVSAGENCPYSLQLVFSQLEAPRPVRQVRLYHRVAGGALYDVTGWTAEEAPCPALCAVVEDSGQGRAFLVYGGEGGLRLRPAGSGAPWELSASDQWGESHLLLADREDVVWEEEA